MTDTGIIDALKHFNLSVPYLPFGNGHINSTFILQSDPKYILQLINTSIFNDPDALMNNIEAVTEHLRKKYAQFGYDPDRCTMKIIKTTDGKNYYKAPDGSCFRVYLYVKDTVWFNSVETPERFYNAGLAFGDFQNMLSDFPSEKLFPVIPDFHNTPKRFERFLDSVKLDKKNRAHTIRKEIEFVLARENLVGQITSKLDSGLIPTRVTHNDTKINNLLFDKASGKAVCVVDLDTVMPGSLLYDYGDALRFGATYSAEDEVDLDKVLFDLELFESFSKGFLESASSFITPEEIELLPLSAILMTFECGMRFLTDYLDGDTYFRINRPTHNLDRARNQFKLVSDMETKRQAMSDVIKKILSV
ncbi:MAG: aminoglycoside phosphotransferase family protein [Oscillospiraceae bacterium]|nr:aminoglycoside phosphotransferase family protein [Oscillospiraceae bacterium]